MTIETMTLVEFHASKLDPGAAMQVKDNPEVHGDPGYLNEMYAFLENNCPSIGETENGERLWSVADLEEVEERLGLTKAAM